MNTFLLWTPWTEHRGVQSKQVSLYHQIELVKESLIGYESLTIHESFLESYMYNLI
jgi:hypothetical protein